MDNAIHFVDGMMKPASMILSICFLWTGMLWLAGAAGFPVLAQEAGGAAALDQGKFVIFSAGKQVGTEEFRLDAGGTAESSDELTLGGRTVKFRTLLVTDPKTMRAERLTLEQEPGLKLVFEIKGSEVRLSGSREATGNTDPDAVVLENNAWYQYCFLMRRYDRQKGGAQQFKAFVPSIMQTIPLTVELKTAAGPLSGSAPKLNRYELTAAVGLRVEILTDSSGKVVYVGVPAQGAEAVREEAAGDLARLRAAASPAGAASAPALDYSAPPGAPFKAEEVAIPVKGYSLAGTLLLPKDGVRPCPAVVMITGSGQQTRDEPIPIAGLEKYRPFRQIAETLASHGIAVLRVDDRGTGGSTGGETLEAATTSDFAGDTRAQVAYLRTRRDIDPARIALVGHSEGGSIAPMVAATDPGIAAIVLMAGPGKRGSDISLYQLEQALDGQPNMTKELREQKLAEERELIKAVQQGGDLSRYPPQAALPWVREWFAYDPIPVIRKVRQPVLILQGALDRQITADQAALLEQAARAAGNQDVAVHVFPGLNHLFLPARTGAFSEYSSLPTNSIPDDVLKTLSDWLQEKLRAGQSRK